MWRDQPLPLLQASQRGQVRMDSAWSCVYVYIYTYTYTGIYLYMCIHTYVCVYTTMMEGFFHFLSASFICRHFLDTQCCNCCLKDIILDFASPK